MTISTIEKLTSDKSTFTLEELRGALNDKIKNEERKKEMEQFIDTAIEEDQKNEKEKKLVVKITKEQLENFIKEEKFDEIQKIIKAREEATEITEGYLDKLMADIGKKKGAIQTGIIAGAGLTGPMLLWGKIKSSIEGVKDTLSGAWTGVKKGWYRRISKLPFLGNWGEKKLAALEEKEKTKKEEKEGKEKESLPITGGIFGGLCVAAGIMVKKLTGVLPGSISEKFKGKEGVDLLSLITKNPAIRLFGKAGLYLFSIGMLYAYIKNNQDTLGPIPTNKEEMGTWLENVAIKSGIGLVNLGKNFREVINGGKLDAYLTEMEKDDEIPPDKQTLEDALSPTLDYLNELKVEINYTAKNIATTAIGLSVLNANFRAIAIRGTMTGSQVGLFLLKTIGKNLFSTLLIIAAAKNAAVLAGHKILVPRDPDEMAKWLKQLIRLPEIRKELGENKIDVEAIDELEEKLPQVTRILTNREALEGKLDEEKERMKKELTEIGLSVIAPDKEHIIRENNLDGLRNANNLLNGFLRNPNTEEMNLINEIQKLIVEVENGGKIETNHIENIEEMAKLTPGIKIEKNYNSKYIKWSLVDRGGNLINELATDNLCVNPEIGEEQYDAARTMTIGKKGYLGASAAIFEGIPGGARNIMTEFRSALNANDTKKGAELMTKIINNKIPILKVGSEIYIEGFMFPVNVFMGIANTLGGNISFQEFLLETGDDVVHCMIFGGTTAIVKNFYDLYKNGKTEWRMGKMILSGATGVTQWKALISGKNLIYPNFKKINISQIKKSLKGSPAKLKKMRGLSGLLVILAPFLADKVTDTIYNSDEIDTESENDPKIEEFLSGLKPITYELNQEDEQGHRAQMLQGDNDIYVKNGFEIIEKEIKKIQTIHKNQMTQFRDYCQKNKQTLRDFFENPEHKNKEIPITPFLSIGCKDGNIILQSTSDDRIAKQFYSEFNYVQKNKWDFEDDGQQSTGEGIVSIVKDYTPGVGSLRDTKQAYRDFQQGNIKDCCINGVIAGVGWVGDAFMVAGLATSWTGVGAAVGLGGGAILKTGAIVLKAVANGSRSVKGIKNIIGSTIDASKSLKGASAVLNIKKGAEFNQQIYNSINDQITVSKDISEPL